MTATLRRLGGCKSPSMTVLHLNFLLPVRSEHSTARKTNREREQYLRAANVRSQE